MKLPLAASLSVLLATTASAQPRTVVPTPFGSISAGWASVFQPMAVARDGVLHSRALPPGWSSPATAEGLLLTLSPVASALENAGMSPEAFAAADPEMQALLLEKALGRADGMVAARSMRVMDRARKIRNSPDAASQELDEAFTELNGLNSFSGYLGGKQNSALRKKIAAAQHEMLEVKNTRLAQAATRTAEALGKTAHDDARSGVATKKNDSRGANTRAALDEIAALEGQFKNGEVALDAAAARIQQLGHMKDEAVQRAAVRALINAAETSLKFGPIYGATDEDGLKTTWRYLVAPRLRQVVSVAADSEYLVVKRIGMNAMLDNLLVGRGTKYREYRRMAVENVTDIASSTKDGAIRGEAVALLVREQSLSGGDPKVIGMISRSIDNIKAGVKNADLPYPAVGGKVVEEGRRFHLRKIGSEVVAVVSVFMAFLAPALFPIGQGLAYVIFGLAALAVAVGAAVFAGRLKHPGVPWYRKSGGEPPDGRPGSRVVPDGRPHLP